MKKKIHFGIHLGILRSDFKLNHNSAFANTDSILVLTSKPKIGFNIGAIGSYHINRFLEIKTVPTFSFAEKNLHYEYGNTTIVDRNFSQIFFELPMLLKFKSQPIKDFKVYVFAGPKYAFDLAGNMKARREDNLPKLKSHDLALDYGVGFELHFPLFILSPEVKVSNSFFNTLDKKVQNEGSKFLNGFKNRTFLFSINFEG